MRLAWLALASFLLNACSTLPTSTGPTTPDQAWQQRHVEMNKLTNWALRGRTAITQADEGVNAGITWQQNGDVYVIRLAGPFSQGGAVLTGNKHKVTLTVDNGDTYSAATPEQLLAESVGLQLPVSALREWVKGIPFSGLGVDNKTLDEQGRLKTLQQAGWEVEYLRYVPFENTTMPGKIFITHPGLNVRLIISDWRHVE